MHVGECWPMVAPEKSTRTVSQSHANVVIHAGGLSCARSFSFASVLAPRLWPSSAALQSREDCWAVRPRWHLRRLGTTRRAQLGATQQPLCREKQDQMTALLMSKKRPSADQSAGCCFRPLRRWLLHKRIKGMPDECGGRPCMWSTWRRSAKPGTRSQLRQEPPWQRTEREQRRRLSHHRAVPPLSRRNRLRQPTRR